MLILVCRYEQLTVRSSELREQLHTELEAIMNSVVGFKVHIQRSLEAYEEFVEQEVVREYEEQDAAAPGGDQQLDEEMEE